MPLRFEKRKIGHIFHKMDKTLAKVKRILQSKTYENCLKFKILILQISGTFPYIWTTQNGMFKLQYSPKLFYYIFFTRLLSVTYFISDVFNHKKMQSFNDETPVFRIILVVTSIIEFFYNLSPFFFLYKHKQLRRTIEKLIKINKVLKVDFIIPLWFFVFFFLICLYNTVSMVGSGFERTSDFLYHVTMLWLNSILHLNIYSFIFFIPYMTKSLVGKMTSEFIHFVEAYKKQFNEENVNLNPIIDKYSNKILKVR